MAFPFESARTAWRAACLLLLATCGGGGCASGGDASPRRITLLTCNVLASEHQDHLRWPALFELFEAQAPDILCLQEVTPWFLDALRQRAWFREHYVVPRIDGLDAFPNGNTVCSRYPIVAAERIVHDGPQGRESLVVHLEVHGAPLAVATCHLESRLGDGPIRAQQLVDLFAALPAHGDAILAGDLNFGDGEQPDSAHLDPAFVDAWRALHRDDPGYTWDVEESRMAARGSFPNEPSRRLDRVLVRSRRWAAESARIVGDEPIDEVGHLFPSDHFALAVSLRASR